MHRSIFRNLKFAPAVLGLLITGCGRGNTSLVEVDTGLKLAQFFVGAYVAPGEVDRVVGEGPGGVTVDMAAWRSLAPDGVAEVEKLAEDGRLEREDVDTLLARAYRATPGFPLALADFEREIGWRTSTESWWSFEMTGSMTRFRRSLFIRIADVRDAVKSFSSGTGLKYPVGSVVVGEHLESDQVVETTVMRRRADGFWDFAAYDAAGGLTSRIEGEPEALVVPSDCFGCHYGDRAFEPEKSFPAPAPSGVHGSREIVVPAEWRRTDVVRLLDEHARRDDGLLGLYATLWVSSLVSGRQAGSLTEADALVLQSLGF